MSEIDLRKAVYKVKKLAISLNWEVNEIKRASTGSYYLELVRFRREWVVVRVANHKQIYDSWLITYSLSPGDLWFFQLVEILSKPFGEVGDVLL